MIDTRNIQAVDLNAQTVTNIDKRNKTYSVSTVSDLNSAPQASSKAEMTAILGRPASIEPSATLTPVKA